MSKFHMALFGAFTLAVSGISVAGPIIIAGTDADDHGSTTAAGNLDGWLFMQKSFENIAAQVTNGNKSVVCVGCGSGLAASAFGAAFDKSNLVGAGWTRITLLSTTDIASFFDGTGATNIGSVGIYYMPTDMNNVDGGISDSQISVVNSNAMLLNTFVANGGGLFAQDEQNITGGWDWLTTLLPGIVKHADGTQVDNNTLTITAAGMAAFPGLTNTDVSNGTPWHSWFSGDFGGLSTLVTGPVPGGQ